MTSPTQLNTATIIVGSVALIVENIPNMIEAAIRIRDLLRQQGMEVNIVDINRRAIEANTETERIIAAWRAKHPEV